MKWDSVTLTAATTCAANTTTNLVNLSGNKTVLGAFLNTNNTTNANFLILYGTRSSSKFSIYARNTTSSAVTIPKDTIIFFAYIEQ